MIFNPLVQLPREQADEDSVSSTSLGLGLYIAHEIVAMHGGTMMAESSEAGRHGIQCAHLPRFQPTRPEPRL